MMLGEHLGKQRGAIVGIGFLIQVKHLATDALGVSPVRGMPPMLVDKTRIA
jgi:hypothetical protein